MSYNYFNTEIKPCGKFTTCAKEAIEGYNL